MWIRAIFIQVHWQRQHLFQHRHRRQTAYAVGEHGLQNALYDAGITVNEIHPDYVIIGEADNYCYDHIVKATRFVNEGARLIGTNYDLTGPVEGGIVPACRALMAPIELATGKQAYYVGKPNALMMRTGLRILGVHSEDAAIIGDRMDTDIVAGVSNPVWIRFWCCQG